MFRNDPLESMKVSSTFDSIPFIAEYLQKEIERQIRRLFQEDLPVAVHRLSLRLWNPEYAASLCEEATAPSKPLHFAGSTDEQDELDMEDQFVNPLLAPADGWDGPSTMFSQKNLLKLSSLVDVQNTLSLGTPKICDAVFRAWASGGSNTATMWDRPGSLEAPVPNGPTTYTFSENGDAVETQSVVSSSSNRLQSGMVTPSGRHATPAGAPGRRKKKHRTVDLRKNKKEKATESSASSTTDTKTSVSSAPTSESAIDDGFCERPAVAIRRVRTDSIDYDSDSRPTPPLRPRNTAQQTAPIKLQCPPLPTNSVSTEDITYPPTARISSLKTPSRAPAHKLATPTAGKEKEAMRAHEAWRERQGPAPKLRMPSGMQGGILEQAILSKIMGEIQRTIEEERIKRGGADVRQKWGVERELENLCGDELPAYRAE